MDAPGGQSFIVPDAVLFVNGIPLVVVECKSPAITDPLGAAIAQLLRYSNQRGWIEAEEGAERLFHYNQLLVATSFEHARAGTIGASPEHFLEWKDTSPVPTAQVAASLGVEQLSRQQSLVAGMLRPAHLIDLLQNFTLFQQTSSRTVKIVARYQQFRAVHAAIRRLNEGQTRAQHGLTDQRGGVIWHTQGSGKSLTMVFLLRKMRTIPRLRRFKVVIITDRTDLEKQLKETAALSGENIRSSRNINHLKQILRENGPDLIFSTIQKYRDTDIPQMPAQAQPSVQLHMAAETQGAYVAEDAAGESFGTLNPSEEILALVDEAHRTQAGELHANLLASLPNCARIGFTGTPIMIGRRKYTQEIFGPFIDTYTILESEADGATVPILYEGRTTEAVVADGRSLDQLFEDMFVGRSPRELEAIKAKYAIKENILEAPLLIQAKAANMLRHYIQTALPNGFKAQLVASSRLAAVRYQAALEAAKQELIAQLEAIDQEWLDLTENELDQLGAEPRFLVWAHIHLETIRRLSFAAVISANEQQDGPAWRQWTDKAKIDDHIARFKKPLISDDPNRQDGLAFLCVQSMLITDFDAPIEQVMYLDRMIQGPELLQAIARVNRTAPNKSHGLVVDYFGVVNHLQQALSAYSSNDVQGALTNFADELPTLVARHRRVVGLFRLNGISNIANVEACVELLRDQQLRASFIVNLKQFLESQDIVLPRREALPYVQDAKLLGLINKMASNRYRDNQLNMLGVGQKVRQLIDQHIEAKGISPYPTNLDS